MNRTRLFVILNIVGLVFWILFVFVEILRYVCQKEEPLRDPEDIVGSVLFLQWYLIMQILVFFIVKKKYRSCLIGYIISGVFCDAASFSFFLGILIHLTRYEDEGVLKVDFAKGEGHKFEYSWHCCGLNSYQDYNKKKLPIPVSCCPQEVRKIDECSTEDYKLLRGCLLALRTHRSLLIPIPIVCLPLFIIQFVALLIAGAILRTIERERQPQEDQ